MTPRIALVLAVGTALSAAALAAQNVPAAAPIESLEVWAGRDSLDAVALHRLAIGYLSRERYDRADSVLRRAAALDQQNADVPLALSVVQDRNRRFWNELRRHGGDTAVARERRFRTAMLRKAFLLDPFVDIRVLALSDERRGSASPALREMARATTFGYDFFYRLMNTYLAMELQHHHQVFDSVPPGLIWFHGLTAARAGDMTAARNDFATLVRVSTSWDQGESVEEVPLRTNEFRYILAAVNQRLRLRETAFALYREVLSNDVGNYMAHVQLARLHEAGAEWSQAVRARRAAAELNPDDPALTRQLGETLRRAGRAFDAEEALLRARGANPLDPLVHYDLGLVWYQLGRHDEAREAFTTFLALAPSRMATQIADARERLAGGP